MTDEELTLKFAEMTAAYKEQCEKVSEAEKNLEEAEKSLEYIKSVPLQTDADYMRLTGNEEVPADLNSALLFERAQAEQMRDEAAASLLAAEKAAEQSTRDVAAGATFDELYENFSRISNDYHSKNEECEEAEKLYKEKEAAWNEAAKQMVGTADNEKEKIVYRKAKDEMDAVNEVLAARESERAALYEEAELASLFLEVKRAEDEKVRKEDMNYVVHSARAYCEFGLRASYIGLTISNGVFINGYPQMTVKDYEPDLNILNFGGCRNPNNPSTRAASLQAAADANSDNTWFDNRVLTIKEFFFGKKDDAHISVREKVPGICNMEFSSTDGEIGWNDGHDKVLINGKKALLRRSEIICQYGGRIILETSGQPEE